MKVTAKAKRAAETLRQAAASGVACPPLHLHLPADDVALAYAIQEHNTHHWLSQGRRLVGRKIGLTALKVRQQMGIDQPDYGMLFADMAFADCEEIPAGRLLQPKVEGEIAFVLREPLTTPDLTILDVIAAIDYAVPAIEVVDSRIADWQIKILDTIADNASAGLFVLGTQPKRLEKLDLRSCEMQLRYGKKILSSGEGAACFGNPLTAVLWLARKMVALQRPLNAGDVVLSGALGPMAKVEGPGSYELKISGLGSVRAVFAGA